MATPPLVGERVAWSARYLTAICPQTGIGRGNPSTFLIGPEPHARGRLVAINPAVHPLVGVLWDGFMSTQTVNINNLICERDIDTEARQWDIHEAHRRRELMA